MPSKKSEKTSLEIPAELSGLFRKYHDIVLVDNSLADIEVILASIYLIENANKKAGAAYGDCKKMFIALGRKEGNFRANLSQAKKKSLLKEDNRNLFFLVGGLKRIEQVFGQVGKMPVHVIKSGENISAIKLFEEFLASQIGDSDLLLCDSHISSSTLFPFTVLKGKIKSFKVLTANIYDSDKFKDYRKKMSKELGIQIEVKINQKIHERYIISKGKCWSIGSSIKDFGNKDTILKEISEVVASMKELFELRWNEGTSLS